MRRGGLWVLFSKALLCVGAEGTRSASAVGVGHMYRSRKLFSVFRGIGLHVSSHSLSLGL